MKKLLYIYILLFSFVSFSQTEEEDLDLNNYIFVKKGDTATINLKEVVIFPKHKFKNSVDIHYYYWFRRKVFKAYPYAKLASQRLDTLYARLSRIKSKSKRRKYTKRIQKYLEGEFTDQLKKMTRTEGRVLIKLIHRQTGKTVFQNIKEIRSGWKAFWYNTTANLFSLSLKTEYNPATNNEDYLIEDILQRALAEEKLEEQSPKLDVDFEKVVASHKGKVDVEEYKKMFAKLKKKKKRKKVSKKKQ